MASAALLLCDKVAKFHQRERTGETAAEFTVTSFMHAPIRNVAHENYCGNPINGIDTINGLLALRYAEP